MRPVGDAVPETLHRRILADIEERILSGSWRPGDRIPSEHELAERYGCSRMTVNNALTQLARAGYVERRSAHLMHHARHQPGIVDHYRASPDSSASAAHPISSCNSGRSWSALRQTNSSVRRQRECPWTPAWL